MQAFQYNRYGDARVLRKCELNKPRPKPDELLIKVEASSINASDKEMLSAQPAIIRLIGPFRPRFKILGSDIAGTVCAKGENVKDFEVGDHVYGDIYGQWGGFAD